MDLSECPNEYVPKNGVAGSKDSEFKILIAVPNRPWNLADASLPRDSLVDDELRAVSWKVSEATFVLLLQCLFRWPAHLHFRK